MGILDDLYAALFGKSGGYTDVMQQPQEPQQPIVPQSYAGGGDQGWRQANPFEQAMMDIKGWGSDVTTDINKFLGVGNEETGYRQDILGDWANVINFDQDDSGSVDLGEVIGTVPRFLSAAGNTALSLPGMMVEGFTEAPAYISAGLTGSRMTQDDAYDYENGMVKEGDLDAAERLGSIVYGGLNVVPVGFGSVASKVGTGIAKKAGVELFEDVAENAARQGLKNAPDAIEVLTAQAAKGGAAKGMATGIGLRAGEQFLEEGAEEAIQEVGLNALNDRDLGENVFESFIGGGLAGGTMGGFRGAKSGLGYSMSSPSWLTGEQEQPDVANTFNRSMYDGSNSHGITFATVDRDLQNDMQKASKIPGATIGMGYNTDPTLNENEFEIGFDQLSEMIANEALFDNEGDRKITNYLNSILPGKRYADMIIDANATKDGAEYLIPEIDMALKSVAPENLLDFVYFKNPGGTKGSTRVSLRGVKNGSALGVSKVGAINMNADFDTDRYGLMFDYDGAYSEVKRPFELLFGNNPHENLDDLNQYLHIDSKNWKDFAEKIIAALDGKIDFGKNAVNDDIKTKEEFDALVRLAAANLAKVKNPSSEVDLSSLSDEQRKTVLSLFNGEFSDFARVMSFAYSKPAGAETSSSMSVAAAEAHRESVVSRPQVQSQVSELVSNLDDNFAGGHSGKAGTTTKDKITGGGIAIIERWRQRLWVSLRDADASCREFLSMYFYVKNYAMVWENDGHIEFTESDLISALAKYQLGIEQDGVHPENIASAVVYEGAVAAATSNGRINSGNLSDALASFKNEYNRLRDIFFESYNLVDQDGKPVFTDKNLMLPSIDESGSNLMSIFSKAILDRKVDDIIQVSDVGAKMLTFRNIAEDVTFSDAKMTEYLSSLSDGTNDTVVKSFITNCRNRIKSDYDNASDALRKSISDLCKDQGLRRAFSKLEYAKNSLSEVNGSDYLAITNALNSIGFFCGRRDFENMGFFGNEDFFRILKKGKMSDTNCFVANEIVEGIKSGDSVRVVNAIEIIALDNRLNKIHETMSSMKGSKSISDSSKIKLIDQLADLSKKGPFYKAVVANLITRINISGEKRGIATDGSVDGIQKIMDSIDADVIEDIDMVVSALIDPNTTMSERNTLVSSLSMSMSEDISFDEGNVLSLMLQDETDILNMTSPSSRCRDGVKYLSLASEQTEYQLSQRSGSIKTLLDGKLGTDAAKSAFMLQLSQQAIIRQEELSTAILQSQLTTSGMYLDKARDKTKVTSPGEAAYVSNSISDIGYSTNEYQNFSQGTFSQESISGNLYISQMLFLTDYIKDVGGITIHTNDGKTEFFSNKRELIDCLVGEKTNGDKDRLEYADLWRLTNAVPQLVNIISPLTKTFSDSNGMMVESFVVKDVDRLTSIAEKLSTTSIDEIEKENRARRRRSIVMSRVLSTPEGQQFLASVLPDSYYEAEGQKEQAKILDKFLDNTFVPWCAQYAATHDPIRRRQMRNSLIGNTMSGSIVDILRLVESDEADRMIYGLVDSQSLEMLEKDIENELVGFEAAKGASSVLEGVKSFMRPILDKLESETGYKENVNDPDFEERLKHDLDGTIDKIRRRINDSGFSFDPNTIIDLIDPLNDLSTIAAIAENASEVKTILPSNYLDSLNENNKTYNESIDQIIEELDNLKNRVGNSVHVPGFDFNGFFGSVDAVINYLQKKKRTDMQGVENSILDAVARHRDASVNALKAVVGSKDDFVTYIESKLAVDNYGETSKNKIVKDIKEYKDAGFSEKLRKKYGTEDFFKRSIVSEILSRSAFMKISGKYPSHGNRIDLFHGLVDIIKNSDDVLSDQELQEDLNRYKEEDVPSVKMSIDISNPDRLYRINQFTFNMMSGNVARQTTIGASKRALFGVFAYAPSDGKFSPLVDQMKYPQRSKRQMYEEYERRIDSNNGGKPERKALYRGFYSDGRPFTLHAFEHEYAEFIMSRNDPRWDSEIIECRLQADESPAYNNLGYLQDPTGGNLNQLLWICDKINLNGAEAMALKTKKNISAFTHASFVSKSSGTKDRNMKSTAKTISASNAAEAVGEFRKMIASVKDAYIDELHEMVKGSRKPIGLTYSDLKVLADTVIQGVVIRFDDGSGRAITLIDMMNGTVMLSDEEVSRISSVHVPVYDLSELARECTQKTFQKFRSAPDVGPIKRKAQEAFASAVIEHGTLNTYDSNIKRTNGIRDVFSGIGKPRQFSTDTFVMPKNSKISFTEAESGVSSFSSEIFGERYKNFNEKATFKNVVNVFGNGEEAKELSYVKGILTNRDEEVFTDAYTTFIDIDGKDDKVIMDGIAWAKAHGTSVILHSRYNNFNSIDGMMKGLFETTVRNFDDKEYEGSIRTYKPLESSTVYKNQHSEANIRPFREEDVWVSVLANMDGADGETVLTYEGERSIIDYGQNAVIEPAQLDFDFSGLGENGVYPENTTMIRLDRNKNNSELRNFEIDPTVADMLARQLKKGNRADAQLANQIETAAKQYIDYALTNGNDMHDSKSYRTHAKASGRFTCMGISRVEMSDGVSYLVPMIVETETGADVTFSAETVVIGNKEQVFGYSAFVRRKIAEDNGRFTVNKLFFPIAAIKTTAQINNPNKRWPSCRTAISDGYGLSVHSITYIDQNGGKFNPALAKTETYLNYMRKKGASMFFIKDGDKWAIAPFLTKLHDAEGNLISHEEISSIFAEPQSGSAFNVWEKIASGQYKFDYDVNNAEFNQLFDNALLSTIRFCCNAKISPLYVLSSFVPKQVSPDNNVENLESIRYSQSDLMKSLTTDDIGLVFGNLSEGHIQELFSHMMPDDIEPQWEGRIKSDKDYTFDRSGMCKVEGFGDERQMILIHKRPNMDSTKSDWQEAGWQGALGNKINQMTIFSGQQGDFDMLIADNFASIGAARQAYEMADKIKNKRRSIYRNGGKMSGDSGSVDTLKRIGSNVYIERDPVIVEQERKIRSLEREIGRRFYNIPFPIRDKNGDTLDMSIENGQFVNDDVNTMYLDARDKWGFSKSKSNFGPEEFMLVLKTAYAYTKEDGNKFAGFNIAEVRKVIEKIASNIDQVGLPVTPDPMANNGKSSRYGICVLPQRLVSMFAENNPMTREKFTDESTGEFSLKAMQETMLKFHTEQRTQMHGESIQRKAMIGNMATVFSRGTDMQNDTRLAQTRLGVTVAEVGQEIGNISVLWWGKDYKGWDLIDKMSKDSEAAFEREAKIIDNMTLSWSKKNPSESSVVDERVGKWSLQKYADNLIAAKQVMAVSTPYLFPASIMDRMVMITPMRAILHSSIFGKLKGVGMDSRVQEKLGSSVEASNMASVIAQQCKSKEFLSEFGVIKSLFNMQNMTTVVEEASANGMSLTGYAASQKANSTFMKKLASSAFDFASGKNVGANFQAEVFVYDLLRRISLDDRFDALWVRHDGQKSEIDKLIENPASIMSQCFSKDCPFRVQALQAFNTAMKGDACQKTVFSILVNYICESNGAVNFFAKTFISPFMQYGINITGRHLNSILPMSALNWLVVNALKDKNVPGLKTWSDGEPMNIKWSDLGIESTLTATSLRDAIVQDITHMGIMWTAAVVVGLGCLEPPDDDDDEKWCNVDEWTFMGQRISMNWWMKDTLGPVLGIACAMKSAQFGKPNMSVLMNTMTECVSSNPVFRASDMVNMLFDPYGEYMESYYDDLARYENTSDGGPTSAAEVLAANFSVAGMNWATGFILPSFLKELYTHSTPYEVSYKRVYETNAQGLLTEEGAAGKTVYTDYFDAKLRLATRKNPILAAACDFLLSPTTGYFASEMPNTVYYDPAQMESIQAYSLYTTDEYGNKVPKSDAECEAIAMSVILKLQQYNDMQELRDTGFCLPYETMQYVGDMLYDIAYTGTSQYQNALLSGTLDYNVLGDGDYDLGRQRAEELASISSNTSNYWKSMYYDKLWSDEMKSGIAMYNRYNTTYEQDENGEWYATGFRNNYADLMMPWATAPDTRDQANETMGFGIEGNDWATRSVVTGDSTGERALIPYVANVKTPEFGGNKTESGYSKTYGGFSYGGYSGGYGYSGGSGSGHRSSNFNYSTPRNYYNYVRPYGENMSTPKVDTTPYKNGRDLIDYNFSTKGSRQAYKRSDL